MITTTRVKSPSGCGTTLVWASTSSYTIEVCCPRCGRSVEPVTTGQRYGWQQAAVMRCAACPWRGVLNVELSEIGPSQQDRLIDRERRAIAREMTNA